VDDYLVGSYVLALGELGDFDKFKYLRFAFFMIFSLFIPLILMNMLIAIMSDCYERVQSNAVAADFKALAGMLLEQEELAYWYYSKFKPTKVIFIPQYMMVSFAGTLENQLANQ